MKRAILAALAALLLMTTPVFGVTILKEEQKAPAIVGDASWGGSISYDFNDRHGRLVVRHVCQEVYEFYGDGSILIGPILQNAYLSPGQTITLNAWPATSWGYCVSQLVAADDHDGVGHSDLVFLVEP